MAEAIAALRQRSAFSSTMPEGCHPSRRIMDLTEADWDRIHRVNSKRCLFLSYSGWPAK